MDTVILSVPRRARDAALEALGTLRVLEQYPRRNGDRHLIRVPFSVAHDAAAALRSARVPYAVSRVLRHSWFPFLSLYQFGAITLLVLEDEAYVPARMYAAPAESVFPGEPIRLLDTTEFEPITPSILREARFLRRLRREGCGWLYMPMGEKHDAQPGARTA